jgi:4-amino-4-deoxy-L-arabinose transferase-like glycosyltransferase
MPWGNTWYQPLLFYIVSMVLVVAPLSEFAVRLPVAIVGGVITPILMYAVALRLFKRRGLALFCAVVLALTPPQLILSRQALDYVCPLPFILGWLWFLIDYTDTRRIKSAVLGALCLGLGFYSYIASWVMMPIYFAMSAIVFWRCGRWWQPRLDLLRRWCSLSRGCGRIRRCSARRSIAITCRTRNRSR